MKAFIVISEKGKEMFRNKRRKVEKTKQVND